MKKKTADVRRAEVKAVQEAGFPGYDRTLHSKCKKPEWYGIMRVPEAEAALNGVNQPQKTVAASVAAKAAVRPREDGRKFKHRVCCRLPESEYKAVHKSFEASSDKTMQGYLRRVLKEYVEQEKYRLDVAASKAAGD